MGLKQMLRRWLAVPEPWPMTLYGNVHVEVPLRRTSVDPIRIRVSGPARHGMATAEGHITSVHSDTEGRITIEVVADHIKMDARRF